MKLPLDTDLSSVGYISEIMAYVKLHLGIKEESDVPPLISWVCGVTGRPLMDLFKLY